MLFVAHLITINSYQRIKERPQKGVSFKTKIVFFFLHHRRCLISSHERANVARKCLYLLCNSTQGTFCEMNVSERLKLVFRRKRLKLKKPSSSIDDSWPPSSTVVPTLPTTYSVYKVEVAIKRKAWKINTNTPPLPAI